ncbi:MAG: DEAD/DEAH box helicase [Alphaproteobacteria bacterium]|nr:DEAD/DEAH box helicase [Alphaproteobacteria bacterium]
MSFTDLGLSETVLNAVTDAGYRHPTPIQEQAIPIVLQGRDVLGCAQTGTGKTAAFTLPMIDILASGQAKARMPRSLILEPTRELAAQVADNFVTYGKYHPLTVALLIGGVRMDEQNALIDRGVDVLIATPGRLLDHAQNGRLLLNGIKILVIDEADRMLDMGFIPDVEKIVSLTPQFRQTLFFSATMPPEIRRLADAFLHNPKEISVSPPASPAETVEQSMVMVQERDKREALRTLLRTQNVASALIFCNRKKDIGVLTGSLQRHGFKAEALHGDMSQPARTETLERFKQGEFGLLVCSDVAARGLDIQGLPYVFLFDVPMHAEDYVHRIGRTGRAGMVGRSVTLATPGDGKFLAAIERLIRKSIPRVTLSGLSASPTETNQAEAAHPPVVAREIPAPAQERQRAPARQGNRPARPEPRRQDQRASGTPPGQLTRRRRAVDDDAPVVGLGDHVPAFLMNTISIPRKPDEVDEDPIE